MLPTDPTLPDTPIECGLTSAFTSRGPIWVWVRDALATICSAVPFAFEFSYEDRDLEGGAWEVGRRNVANNSLSMRPTYT